ncbi:MAG: type I-D CRISPR-associated protein Cas7/Csc2 [Candidatus Thorarchaeota archaeon]|nr:MAG: type I-D CRISPR-associated protein Cas7/Csc2 [Candidatus Thorarchaeota archaeon]
MILASKQKAVERRHESQIIRDILPDAPECYLKDNLCLKCPVCALNGGIKAEKGAGEISVKSRVLYQTAFSVLPFEEIVESITFNAVNERTTKTEQALGERELVKPDTYFLSAVTLLAPTLDELKFYLYSMLHTTRYGAETRGMGVIENRLLGLVLSDSEHFSALGLTMDVYAALVEGKDTPALTYQAVLDRIHDGVMSEIADSADRVFSADEVVKIEQALRAAKPTKEWIEKLYHDAQAFREKILNSEG